MTAPLPLLAITLGDAAGTGPEIIVKALAQPGVRALARLLVVGDAATLARALTFTGVSAEIRAVASPEAAAFAPGGIDVLDLHNIDLARLQLGRVDPRSLIEAIKLAAILAGNRRK